MAQPPVVIAILTSDWHLCHRPPVARSAEPDWYAAMQRPLDQINALLDYHSKPGVGNDCILVIAGDIFDKSGAPPHTLPAELINWTLEQPVLRQRWVYAVPGNHDLPNHRYEDVYNSAYWTLVKAGRIDNLEPLGSNIMRTVGQVRLNLVGFPCGIPVEPCPEPLPGGINLAVVHSYIWTKEHKYKDAPMEQRVAVYKQELGGYTCAVFGDNHKGFQAGNILNCGSLMRRTIDQIHYQPIVGRLWSDGTIDTYELDCSQDKFIDPDVAMEVIDKAAEVEEMMLELKGLGMALVEFKNAVKRYLEGGGVSTPVRDVILELLGGKRA